MNDEIYVYHIRLPDRVREVVTPCPDGYTIYIDDRLSRDQAEREYHHALEHIRHDDLNADRRADEIEADRR